MDERLRFIARLIQLPAAAETLWQLQWGLQ